MARPHPQQHTFVPAGDTIEISLDWLPAPRRLPEHTDDEFRAIKRRWARDMTVRWMYRDEWLIGRDNYDTISIGTMLGARIAGTPEGMNSRKKPRPFFMRP